MVKEVVAAAHPLQLPTVTLQPLDHRRAIHMHTICIVAVGVEKKRSRSGR